MFYQFYAQVFKNDFTDRMLPLNDCGSDDLTVSEKRGILPS